MAVRKCAYKYVFSSVLEINRSVYLEKCAYYYSSVRFISECFALIEGSVLWCSVIVLCLCPWKNICNSQFANYALFFFFPLKVAQLVHDLAPLSKTTLLMSVACLLDNVPFVLFYRALFILLFPSLSLSLYFTFQLNFWHFWRRKLSDAVNTI